MENIKINDTLNSAFGNFTLNVEQDLTDNADIIARINDIDNIEITSKPIRIRYIKHTLKCPKCGTDMKPENIVLTSSPPQYPHKCPNCGFKLRYGIKHQYPYFEQIVEDEN